MSIVLEPYRNHKENLGRLKALYNSAFPKEERAPFYLMKRKADRGRGELLAVRDGENFVGLVYMICCRDMAYLFYFAIDEPLRGRGYGSKVLTAVKERYHGKRLFLAREQLDPSADNYEQRIKRHYFYKHNGFEDMACRIKEASVIYDVMGIGGKVSEKEYEELITRWSGRLLRKIIDMRLIELD